MGKHTIILFQPAGLTSRTFFDYPSVAIAMDAIVKQYEKQLKQMNPQVQHITYDIQHLLKYIDDLKDISALVFDDRTNQYEPYGKDWIKQKIFTSLKQQAGR